MLSVECCLLMRLGLLKPSTLADFTLAPALLRNSEKISRNRLYNYNWVERLLLDPRANGLGIRCLLAPTCLLEILRACFDKPKMFAYLHITKIHKM